MGPARRWRGFDPLRIVAAVMVVVSHAWYLTGRPAPLLLAWSGAELNIGTLAVCAFFVSSGFLVSESWDRDPSLSRFTARRVARLWPGLVLVALLSAFVLGALVTDVERATYLTSAQTWGYAVGNIVMIPHYLLPGVFLASSDPSVNGSLWTLPVEAICYVALATLGVLGALRSTRVLGAVTAAALLAAWALDLGHEPTAEGDARSWIPRLFALFLLGALARRLDVPRRTTWAVGTLALLTLSRLTPTPTSGLGYLAIAYLVVWFGTADWAWIRHVHRLGDPSYGIYLWGWPISQTLVLLGIGTALPLAVATSVIALPVGYLSWWLVERRCLSATRRRLAHGSADPLVVIATPAKDAI